MKKTTKLKYLFFIISMIFIFTACNKEETPKSPTGGTEEKTEDAATGEKRPADSTPYTTDITNIKSSPVTQLADSSRARKDRIVFAQGADLTVMDPHRGTQERAYSFTNNLYDTLVEFDEDYNMQPCLAEKWEITDEGKGLKLFLREGVTFHNGDSFTAKDVAWTMQKRTEMNKSSAYGQAYDNATIEDDYTITLNLKYPFPTFVYYLGDPAFAMVPDGYTEEMLTTDPVGTGPYKLKEFQVGDHYIAEKFDDYWGGEVLTNEIELKIIPEAAQRTILLETGDIDVAYSISYNDISKVEANSQLELLAGPSMKIFMMFLNEKSEAVPALANKDVRKALEMAIDKELLVQAVTYGYGRASWSVVPDTAAEWIDYPINEYDLGAAKKLMEDAGYADGFSMKVWVDSDQMNQETVTILQDQWKKINVNLEIETQDANTTNSRYDAGEDYGGLYWFYSCNSGHISYTLHHTMFSESSSRNYSHFENAEFDKLVVEWEQTADPEKNKEQVKRLFEIIDEETPQIPLYNEMKVIGATANLAGFRFDRIGAHQLHKAVVYAD